VKTAGLKFFISFLTFFCTSCLLVLIAVGYIYLPTPCGSITYNYYFGCYSAGMVQSRWRHIGHQRSSGSSRQTGGSDGPSHLRGTASYSSGFSRGSRFRGSTHTLNTRSCCGVDTVRRQRSLCEREPLDRLNIQFLATTRLGQCAVNVN